MKGPFSIWGCFGLTLWIDAWTLVTYRFGKKRRVKKINPYNPVREVSVIIPAHKEDDNILQTIQALKRERYPIKKIVVCGDAESRTMARLVRSVMHRFASLVYLECPDKSKSRKINYAVRTLGAELGEFVYVRDARVIGNATCIERMVAHFNGRDIAAVTSYGRLSVPKNFLSRAYYYGKAWINEIGRFRKIAQEKRRAVFVVCGASTMYRRKVLEKLPIPHRTKTEDTYYTWLLQRKGYAIRVADNAMVSAPEIDGKGFDGILSQMRQSYRWSSGTFQCLFFESWNLPKNKRLFYSTIIPGFVEAAMYAVPLTFFPAFLIFLPKAFIGFIIGDTVFSLAGTFIIIPRKFVKTVVHYPQIILFKYLNAAVFVTALCVVGVQGITGNTKSWSNQWSPLATDKLKGSVAKT